MALSPGSVIGSYRIIAPLGAGGMGEVYRATDTRLGRDVAVKILPEHLSNLAEARERFDREAKVISSLSHPHICTLFDIGAQDDVAYIVMELLEGETLAARLERGPLKLDEALRYGAQTADALDKAHRRGVVHRDLKPANLMLTRTGVKILDFGVAKLREEHAGSQAGQGTGILPTIAPTRTTPLTTQGMIVGTMQYMAPEQLEGKPVDHRADIFSLGAVLYEMMTGKRAFDGASQASVIAAILEREPRPVSEIAVESPLSLDRLIRRCLAKDPDERWQTATDVKSELEWIGQETTGTGQTRAAVPAASRGSSSRLTAMGAIAGAAAMVGLGWLLHQPAPVQVQVVRTSIVLPRGTSLDTDNTSVALSPDGTKLAYTASERGGALRLYVRPLDSLTSQALAGTEGATYPFWSPDGRTLGFMADRKLKKVPASGGAVLSICDVVDGRGATWGADGVIVFAPRSKGGLYQVSASGGIPVELTAPADITVTHRNPRFLPDGKRLLFYSGSTGAKTEGTDGVHSLDLATKATSLVVAGKSEGLFVEPGYLVFVRDSNLLAQRVDPKSLVLSGDAVPVAENVQFNMFRATGTYSFSQNGMMVYQSGAILAANQLTWFDLDGKRAGTLGEPAIFWLPMEISPDGRRVAVTVRHPDGGSDIWLYDLARGLGSRFTLGPTNALLPVWSPDGSQLAYTDGSGAVFVKSSDGASAPRQVLPQTGIGFNLADWSPDGEHLLVFAEMGKTGTDLLVMSMKGDPKPVPLLATAAEEQLGRFSPDGRWISYISDESGRSELYVASFPGPGGKWQISINGADSGGWLGDSGEVFYIDANGKFFAVPITQGGGGLSVGTPRPLFSGAPQHIVTGDFTPDGRRFLGATPLESAAGPMLTLVTGWTAPLSQR